MEKDAEKLNYLRNYVSEHKSQYVIYPAVSSKYMYDPISQTKLWVKKFANIC